jgi:hypothetical protein
MAGDVESNEAVGDIRIVQACAIAHAQIWIEKVGYLSSRLQIYRGVQIGRCRLPMSGAPLKAVGAEVK